MSDPVVLDYYSSRISTEMHEFTTLYTFESSLLLRNAKGEIITRIVLADTNEVFHVTHRAKLAEYLPPPPTRLLMKKVSASQAVLVDVNGLNNANMQSNSGSAGETPFAYINNNKDKLAPVQRDLLAVIDQKINAL